MKVKYTSGGNPPRHAGLFVDDPTRQGGLGTRIAFWPAGPYPITQENVDCVVACYRGETLSRTAVRQILKRRGDDHRRI
jgi:hypothetical protein